MSTLWGCPIHLLVEVEQNTLQVPNAIRLEGRQFVLDAGVVLDAIRVHREADYSPGYPADYATRQEVADLRTKVNELASRLGRLEAEPPGGHIIR